MTKSLDACFLVAADFSNPARLFSWHKIVQESLDVASRQGASIYITSAQKGGGGVKKCTKFADKQNRFYGGGYQLLWTSYMDPPSRNRYRLSPLLVPPMQSRESDASSAAPQLFTSLWELSFCSSFILPLLRSFFSFSEMETNWVFTSFALSVKERRTAHVGKGQNAAILILYLTPNLQVRSK